MINKNCKSQAIVIHTTVFFCLRIDVFLFDLSKKSNHLSFILKIANHREQEEYVLCSEPSESIFKRIRHTIT